MTTTTTKLKSNAVLIADSAGGQPYRRIVGEEGADPTTAQPALFTPSDAGYEPTVYANANTTLLLANRLAPNATFSPTSLIWRLPLFYTLGYTRTPGTTPDLVFSFQRQGLGQAFVNPANYRGEVANQAAMVLLTQAVAGDWCQRTDLFAAGSRGGQVFVLTTDPYSTAGNWTALGMTLANRPNIAWGNIASQAAMLALSNAIPGDFIVRTDASSTTYQLSAAPYSTLANWVTRTDADKPIDPKITILDPAGIAVSNSPSMGYPESQYKTMGYGNDTWFVR